LGILTAITQELLLAFRYLDCGGVLCAGILMKIGAVRRVYAALLVIPKAKRIERSPALFETEIVVFMSLY
jgi:hypothetical protein